MWKSYCLSSYWWLNFSSTPALSSVQPTCFKNISIFHSNSPYIIQKMGELVCVDYERCTSKLNERIFSIYLFDYFRYRKSILSTTKKSKYWYKYISTEDQFSIFSSTGIFSSEWSNQLSSKFYRNQFISKLLFSSRLVLQYWLIQRMHRFSHSQVVYSATINVQDYDRSVKELLFSF